LSRIHKIENGLFSTASTRENPILTEQSEEVRIVNTKGMPALSVDGFSNNEADGVTSYQKGLITIGFITLLFASNSPALHSAFELTSNAPPVLLINAVVSTIGLLGVVMASPFLGKFVPDPSAKKQVETDVNSATQSSDNIIMNILGPSAIAGAELGIWKMLGTTANIYGLSQTSSDHGAFLIQLTTLIVPCAQGLMGVPIPSRIWTAIALALGGVFMFTQDPSQQDCATLQGDLLCAVAAIFYATYDLRLFKWGKKVPTDELITTKMVTQSLLSILLLFVLGREDTMAFISQVSLNDLKLIGAVSLWSGLAVNCLAPYLQVSGQQAVGPARAQILYASQPLWAAVMGFFFLGEQVGTEGLIGGTAFLSAMFLAATAESPDPNCPAVECEV
jgi:drug/metabolite transporter (DMT)-like permease